MTKQKVIAIVSQPQECGSSYISFVSTENGQVIEDICIDGFGANECLDFELQEVGDEIVLYDDCGCEPFPGYIDRHIDTPISRHCCYLDEDCKEIANLQQNCRKAGNKFYIKSMEFVKRVDDPIFSDKGEEIKSFFAKYIYRYVVVEKEETLVYNQDNDEFYKTFKERFNIELPYPDRMRLKYDKDIIPMVAKVLNFDVLNTLFF